jgi:hypothetical protein
MQMNTFRGVVVIVGAVIASSWQLAAQSAPPEDLKWDPKLKVDVAEAMKQVEQDPVGSLYVLRDLEMRSDKPKPNNRQRSWLAQYRRSIEPTALESVQRQFDEAAKQLDIRTLMILDAVAHEVLPDRLNRAEPLAGVQKQAFHETLPSPVFRVEGVSATRLDGGYREGGAANQYVITPKPGFKVVTVKATVTNLSDRSDSPLVPRFLGSMKMELTSLTQGLDLDRAAPALGVKAPNSSFRYMDQSFVFLVDATDQVVPCAYIPQRQDGRQTTVRFEFSGGGGMKVSLPQKLKPTESVQFEFIFILPVPQTGPSEYRLWIAGAAPVPIT